MPKVSVIIPVYKAEQYIHKCINSVLSQTYSDFELLLVDDESPDNSGNICEEYARKDKRVRVFHKKNGGVSSARNLGLENAQGEWVTFLDSDDWLDTSTLSVCQPFMEDFDVIRFSMNFVLSDDEKIIRPFLLIDEPQEDHLIRIISRETILGVCGSIFRRELFVKHHISFDTSLINGEDWVVLTKLIFYSKSCKILPLSLYQYNKFNEASCTSNMLYEKHLSAMKALKSIENSILAEKSESYNNALSTAKCELACQFIAPVILNYEQLPNDNIVKYKQLSSLSYKDIYRCNSSFKTKFILFCYLNPLGYFFVNRILSKLYCK